MNIYTIYKITNKVNDKGYIGFDSNWPNRKTEHISNYTNKKIKKILYSAMRKHGIDNFDWEVLYQSDDLDYTLNVMENKMILEHNTFIENGYGYNQTLGGEGTLGRNVTIETRQKMSHARTGHKSSPETKQKMRHIRTGKKASLETRRKMSLARSDYKHSLETKQKIGIANTGKIISEEARQKMREAKLCVYEITKPDGKIDVVYDMAEYCRENDLNHGNMIQAVLGKQKHHKQYMGRKLNDYYS